MLSTTSSDFAQWGLLCLSSLVCVVFLFGLLVWQNMVIITIMLILLHTCVPTNFEEWGEVPSLWITFASVRYSMVANILFMELLYDNDSIATASASKWIFIRKIWIWFVGLRVTEEFIVCELTLQNTFVGQFITFYFVWMACIVFSRFKSHTCAWAEPWNEIKKTTIHLKT